MENITPLLANIALWSCLVGATVLGLSMVYLGLVSFFSGYANSDSWRRIARELEKECLCLQRQLETMQKDQLRKHTTTGAKP